MRTAAKARLKAFRPAAVASPVPPIARQVPALTEVVAPTAAMSSKGTGREGVVLIGVSTGGPRTLELILPNLPAQFPWPILVAQHMPASFTHSFAQRMNGMCAMEVVEANRPMTLEAGTIYIAKGGADMQVVRRAGKLNVIAKPESADFLWHPSVELLGRSVLEHVPCSNVLGIMLTGMGNDGADAFTAIKKRGGRTIAESEDSCVVFGMPAELISRGGATVTLPAEKIAAQVKTWLGC